MDLKLKIEINKKIKKLQKINKAIQKYNQQDNYNENYETYLEQEQKKLINFLAKKCMGNNVSVFC